MDSMLTARVFRQLFSHKTCSKLRYPANPSQLLSRSCARRNHGGGGRYGKKVDEEASTSRWQQRTAFLPPDKLQEFRSAPMVTADALRTHAERPRKVKMLMRDFIEDSLYNPHYGYFPKEATIFSTGEPFLFNTIVDEPSFLQELGRRYTSFEDELDKKVFNEARQLWHTPTELFRPYYGEAIARFLVTNYQLTHYPHHDLIIYELGAGNGTLMMNILDYIRDYHPDIYSRTKYKVIEISSALASLQAAHLQKTDPSGEHLGHVEIINQSVFSWSKIVPAPCYILALEVLDNLAHDSIRYDPYTEQPLQGIVLIDDEGNLFEFYTKDIDPVASRFLKARAAACSRPFNHPLRGSRWMRKFKASLPFAANLTQAEYIPTRLLQLFEMLDSFFPQHQLLIADFDALPDAVEGVNAPVVQTRYQRRTVPVTTPLCMQGYFDILFPTDFHMMEDLYRAVTGKLTKVTSQSDWLRRWAYTEETRCISGENPMLTWYQNSSVMIST